MLQNIIFDNCIDIFKDCEYFIQRRSYYRFVDGYVSMAERFERALFNL